MQLLCVWGHTERPWGYEVRADFEHGGAVYNEVIQFHKQPSTKTIDACVAVRLVELEARQQVPKETEKNPADIIAALEDEKVALLLENSALKRQLAAKVSTVTEVSDGR